MQNEKPGAGGTTNEVETDKLMQPWAVSLNDYVRRGKRAIPHEDWEAPLQ